jgi:hypothetical protein
MIRSKKLLTIVLLLCCTCSFAQITLPMPTNLAATYTKGTRTPDGAPGKNYWQNRADYTIKVNFDPKTRLLSGVVDIDYENNSPNTLYNAWFKLYPNIFKKGVIRDAPVEPEDLTDGVKIKSLSINGNTQDNDKWRITGTNMTVDIPSLHHGEKMHFTIAYSYILNTEANLRTGQVDSGAFFIAYFYPRVAVYDDVDGWNKQPYLGVAEFYNDFCHYHAEITVPGNYEVWGTGTLRNIDEVYTPKIAVRLAEAGRSDKVTDIITEENILAGDITTPSATHTWKIEADSVTDLAFAISNHYIWKASSLVVDPATGRRTRVDAVFNPNHNSYYPVINYARKTVETMSYSFPKWPYPYPHETIFDGTDKMEYPMMVNDTPMDDKEEDITLTDHEIFHTMFPFYMGTNETKYGWMDEGWATIGEWLISPVIDPTIKDDYGMEAYNETAGNEKDVPIMSLTSSLLDDAQFTDVYPKPAMGYLYVKDMLGDSLFTKALHYYISNWHGKHPMPYDFFNCMNTGAGVNMNWFWKAWFFDNGVPDLAITKVTGTQGNYTATITSIGNKPVPIDLTIYFNDGSTQLFHKSIIAWKDGNKTYNVKFTATKPITKLVLGAVHDPDVDKSNNTYVMK